MKLRAVIVLALTSGCASFTSFFGSENTVAYFPDAEGNLQAGLKAMQNKSFDEAETYFEYTRTKYPYVDAATEAELGLGDADFARDKFIEARDRYNNFVRLHPTHVKVDYAAFRAAITHYKEIPSDFFVLPPSAEKDQVEVRNARIALGDFLRLSPSSQYAVEARKTLDEVRRRLADHELYVAEFYAHPNRKKWRGVVTRLQGLEKNYSGLGFDEKVAFGLHEAYVQLEDYDNARAALERYVATREDSADVRRARGLLAELAGKHTAPPPAEDAPDAGS